MLSDRLRGMCWNYLHDWETVEDVLQDTFCQTFEKISGMPGDSDIGAWTHRVAANLCIDELRRRTRRAQAHLGAAASELAMSTAIDEDRSARPEEALELNVTRRLVRAAILSVPDRQRDVLILRDVMGHSEAEAAAALGITCGSVQGLLHRARESFRTAYVNVEAGASLPAECREAVFVFENLRLASLRKDRLRALEGHLTECPRCDARFGAAVRSSRAAAPASSAA